MKKHYTNAFYTITEKKLMQKNIVMYSVFAEKAELMTAKINPGDKIVACGYSDGFVKIFHLKDQLKLHEYNTTQKEHSPVTSLKWRPSDAQDNITSNTLLVANANGSIFQYNTKTDKEIFHTVEEGNQIMAVDYHPAGINFCTAGKDNVIKIYDEETKKIQLKLEGVKWQKTGHCNRLFAVKYKKDQPKLIASGGWDQNVNVWDVRTGEVSYTLHGPHIVGDSIDLFDNTVLTGAHRGRDQLQLWDLRKGEVTHNLKWSEYQKQTDGYIYSCQFCNFQNNIIMAVGSKDVKFFNIELQDKSQILGLNFFEEDNILFTCDSGSNSNRFIVGGKRGQLYHFGTTHNLE